jgi:hypothetical protein
MNINCFDIYKRCEIQIKSKNYEWSKPLNLFIHLQLEEF